ncbi:MAG: response regulator, partial [Ideonella sp.]
GPGMNPAQLARAFEPYFTTRTAQGASGLGLSQVKAFCVAAGGSARLASTVGLGTAVTLLLPAQMPALQPDPASSSIRNDLSDAASTTVKGNAKLLLVEDSDDMAEVTSALLQNHGYRVHWARDADEAWRMLEREHDFSVVLSDVVMPGSTDGLALARKVRQRWPALPVVLISGEFTGSEAGGKLKVLRKPCPPELLVATLQTEIARFESRPANN